MRLEPDEGGIQDRVLDIAFRYPLKSLNPFTSEHGEAAAGALVLMIWAIASTLLSGGATVFVVLVALALFGWHVFAFLVQAMAGEGR